MADKMAAVQGYGCILSVYILSVIAYCISPYASFYAGLSCYFMHFVLILLYTTRGYSIKSTLNYIFEVSLTIN